MTQKNNLIRATPLGVEERPKLNAPFTEKEIEAINLKRSSKTEHLVLLTELSKWAEQVVE